MSSFTQGLAAGAQWVATATLQQAAQARAFEDVLTLHPELLLYWAETAVQGAAFWLSILHQCGHSRRLKDEAFLRGFGEGAKEGAKLRYQEARKELEAQQRRDQLHQEFERFLAERQ
jgi:hypothetical protein